MNQLLGCVAGIVIINFHPWLSGEQRIELCEMCAFASITLEELLLYKLFPCLGSIRTHSIDVPPTAPHNSQITSMFIRVRMAKQGSHLTH